MAARKLTRDADGNLVVFSTKRGSPTTCSPNCTGIYRFQGELYCKHFNCIAGERDPDCIKNEVKGGT